MKIFSLFGIHYPAFTLRKVSTQLRTTHMHRHCFSPYLSSLEQFTTTLPFRAYIPYINFNFSFILSAIITNNKNCLFWSSFLKVWFRYTVYYIISLYQLLHTQSSIIRPSKCAMYFILRIVNYKPCHNCVKHVDILKLLLWQVLRKKLLLEESKLAL